MVTQTEEGYGRKPEAYELRRLPLYLLVENSVWMDEAATASAWETAGGVLEWAKNHSTRQYPLCVTVISYGTTAHILCAALPCESVDLTHLRRGAASSAHEPLLDRAFAALRNSLESDLLRWGKPDGDSTPVVVLLSSGDYRTQVPEGDYAFQVLLETVRKCSVILVQFSEIGPKARMRELLWQADAVSPRESNRMMERLDKDVRRFHAERQRPVSRSHSDEQIVRTPKKSPARSSHGRGIGIAVVGAAILIVLFAVVRSRLDGRYVVLTREIDYGTLMPDSDGKVSATTWLKLWAPVGRTKSKVTIRLDTFFDGKPVPPSVSTIAITGRTARIPIPIEVVRLTPSGAHSLTGRVTLVCSDPNVRISPAELPLRAAIQPRGSD
jgi:hypothetical protein